MILVCSRHIRSLLWIGIVNAMFWLTMTTLTVVGQSRESATATARAVDQLDNRVTRVEASDMDNRIAIAEMRATMRNVIATVSDVQKDVLDIRSLIVTMVWAVIGFFVTVTGGLIATLWSVRKGWLRTSER
jgi:hypothetical protein